MKKMLAIITLSMIMFSCAKDTTLVTPPVTDPAPKVKKISPSNGSRNTTLLYNNTGRLIQMTEIGVSLDTSSVSYYNYTGSTLTVQDLFPGNTANNSQYNYQLNASGFVTTGTLAGNAYVQYSFIYNSDGQITEKKTTGINGPANAKETITYYYSNKQCDSVKTERTWQAAGTYEVIVYGYYTDKTDSRNQFFYYRDYLGNPPATKPIKSVTTKNYSISNPGGTVASLYQYSYEYDNKGRIVKETGNPAGATYPPNVVLYEYY